MLDLAFTEVRLSLVDKDYRQKSCLSEFLEFDSLMLRRDFRCLIDPAFEVILSLFIELSPFNSVLRLKVWILSNEVWSSSLSLRWNLTLELIEDYLEDLRLFFRVSEWTLALCFLPLSGVDYEDLVYYVGLNVVLLCIGVFEWFRLLLPFLPFFACLLAGS